MNLTFSTSKSIIPSLLGLFLFSIACNSNQSNSEESEVELKTEPVLTMDWKTDTVFTGSESTLYDPVSKAIYVSSGNTKSSLKDGDGFISKIRPDGTIDNLKWVTDLNAPKGMAINDGKLYVSDIDEILGIQLSNGNITERIVVDSAKFLNDVCTDGEYIFFSDMRANTVYRLKDGQYEAIAKNVPNINGLECHAGQLYGLCKEGLIKFNADGSYSTLNTEVLGGDGLVILNDTTFIASRWGGQIFYISGSKTTLLVDTQEEKSNTADITFVPETQQVIVPTFLKNEVASYSLSFE